MSSEIKTIKYNDFQSFINYSYGKDPKLNSINIVCIFYCANKYLVKGLQNYCKNWLRHKLNSKNVCQILETAVKLQQQVYVFN